MIIDESNCRDGNKAVASALLLYYHLATEGGFSGDETVYLDPDLFDGFRFLDVVVDEAYQPEIDEELLREAAVVYLLCDLNDMIAEHEDSFLICEITQNIRAAYEAGRMSAIRETDEIFQLLESRESAFDFARFSAILSTIFDRYVLTTFRRLGQPRQA